MSRALRVKINNNLQVAVCLRVGWLSLRRQLWKCRVSGSVHGRMDSQSYLVAAGARIKDWTSQQLEKIQATLESSDTILSCLSYGWTTNHRLALHSDFYAFYSCILPGFELFTLFKKYIFKLVYAKWPSLMDSVWHIFKNKCLSMLPKKCWSDHLTAYEAPFGQQQWEEQHLTNSVTFRNRTVQQSRPLYGVIDWKS